MNSEIFLEFNAIEAGLSVLLTGLILLSYIVISQLRQNFTLRIIWYLTLANFLWSLATFITSFSLIKAEQDIEDEQYEKFDSEYNIVKDFNVMMIFFQISSRFWNILFALNLYWENQFKTSLDKYEVYAHLLGFGLPVAFIV